MASQPVPPLTSPPQKIALLIKGLGLTIGFPKFGQLFQPRVSERGVGH